MEASDSCFSEPANKLRDHLGLVHIYTGNGKGKTTASLGLAIRALEQGLRVNVIQFLKGGSYISELSAVKRFDNLVIEQFGKGSDDKPDYKDFEPDNLDRERALRGLKRASEVINDCDVLILDEVNVALQLGHLKISEVVDFIKNKPSNTELVLTGRYAPEELFEFADYVTEMRSLKHPFDRGILARKGIDY